MARTRSGMQFAVVTNVCKKENIISMHIHMYIYGFYLLLLMLYLRICLERGGRNVEISVGLTIVTMIEGDRDGDTCGIKREANII